MLNAFENPYIDKIVNKQEPTLTRIFVRKPAALLVISRSKPMIKPKITESKILTITSLSKETNKIETPHVVLKSDNTEKSQTKTVPTTTDMNLHYNIQIHLPETTNMAVYDAIFQSLKKHLM